MLRWGGSGKRGKTEERVDLVGMVIDDANLERLQAGQPIVLDGKTIGMPNVVVLVAYAPGKPMNVRDGLLQLQKLGRDAGASTDSIDDALARYQ